MLPRCALFALTLLLAGGLGVPSAETAEIEAWTAGAQAGGAPSAFALSGSRALAGVSSGDAGGALFGSDDGGVTWHRLAAFGLRNVRALAIDPAPGQPVYAATTGGLFRSLDAGVSWGEVGPVAPGLSYKAVAIDPAQAGTAYVLPTDSMAGAIAYRTTAGGAGPWENVSSGLGPFNILDGVVVDPATHVAWGWHDGAGGSVFSITAGSTAWTPQANGLPGASVSGVAVDRGAGRIVAATSGGAAFIPSTGGVAWTTINGGLTDTSLTSLTGDADGTMLATSLSGALWRLPSGATTWQPVVSSLLGVSARHLTGDQITGGRMLATTAGDAMRPAGEPVVRSSDGGVTWAPATAGFTAAVVEAISAAPRAPGHVMAATDNDGVERSADAGASWSRATGLPSAAVNGVTYDGAKAGVAYAATDSGIFRSTDDGASWGKLGGGAPDSALVLGNDSAGTVYAFDGNDAFRSADGGDTWGLLPADGLAGGIQIGAFFADPAAPGAVFIVTSDGPFYLSAGAATWQARNEGLGAIATSALSFDPRAPATMLAASSRGVFRSRDAGASWAVATTGIPEGAVLGVTFDPQVAGVAYASTAGGVYRTGDGGGSWAPLTGGIPLPLVSQLAFDADGRTLYGATRVIGVVARKRGVVPVATTAPTMTGVARVGSVLTGAAGTWDGVPAPTLTLAWQRCNAAGAGCAPIRGATVSTYRATAADRGSTLRFAVTGANTFGSTTAATAPTARVQGKPGVRKAPHLKGKARVGKLLHAAATFTGPPAPRVSWRWQRCNAKGKGCKPIKLAKKSSYRLRPADRGRRLRAVATARNALGTTVARSKPSAVVR